MKKNYVSLNVQVVEVQLSDCIAGSLPPTIETGETINNMVDTKSVTFSTWGN